MNPRRPSRNGELNPAASGGGSSEASTSSGHAFGAAARAAVYAAIEGRRDVRHFRSDPVEDEVLARNTLVDADLFSVRECLEHGA